MLAAKVDDPRFAELVSDLASFDPIATVSAIAGLITVPDLATAHVRIEFLLNLASATCKGDRQVAPRDLQRWINEVLAADAMAALEDPLEDVFIGAVNISRGTYRIFEGTWESATAHLQYVLDALTFLSTVAEVRALKRQIRSLLTISEEVAERSGLDRWIISSQTAPRSAIVPADIDLERLSTAVSFTADDVERLELTLSDLSPLMNRFPMNPADWSAGSPLHLRPLVQFERKVVLASPTSVSIAIRWHIVEWARKAGRMHDLEAALREIQLNALRAACLEDSHAAPDLDLVSTLPTGDPLLELDDLVIRFDTDKLAHVVLMNETSAWRNEAEADGGYPKIYSEGVIDHCRRCAQMLSAGSQGMTILVGGGFGGDLAIPIPDLGRWMVGADTLDNIVTLLRNDGWEFLRIWRLLGQDRAARDADIWVRNRWGLATLAGYWAEHDFVLVPKEIPFPSVGTRMISIGGDFVRKIRIPNRRELDEHAVRVNRTGLAFRVRRLTPKSYFRRMAARPVYASERFAGAGTLAGVVEKKSFVCWVVCEKRELPSGARDFAFRVWEALLGWIDLCADHFPPLDTSADPVHVTLRFAEDGWNDTTDRDRLELEAALPEFHLDKVHRFINITLRPSFVALVARETNEAERGLVRGVLRAITALIETPADTSWPEPERLLDLTFGGEDARKLHVLETRSPAEVFAKDSRPDPILVPSEERARAELNLGWRVLGGREQAATITTIGSREEAVLFLNRAVDEVWLDLKKLLADLPREGVVEALLRNLDELDRDRDIWRHSARALSSIPVTAHEAAQVSGDRQRSRSFASAACRLLVEMSVCECALGSGPRILTRNDIGTLMATSALLSELGMQSDAIRKGSLPFDLTVHPNGFIDVVQPWTGSVAVPYVQASFEEDFRTDARSYGEFVAKAATRRSHHSASSDAPYDEPIFCRAFIAEFGLSPGRLMDAFAELLEWGTERETSVFVAPEDDLKRRLTDHRGLSIAEADALLSEFALFPRTHWDSAPTGFRDTDWYPWKFRRRLSLLSRPLVKLAQESGGGIVVSLARFGSTLTYLLNGLRYGWFPQGFAWSPEMRSYLGKMADERGEQFTQKTARACRDYGWSVRTNVPMSMLGGVAGLGDIDVLAWRNGDDRLLCIECKRLMPARTPAEILEVLTSFGGKAKDRLGKHLRRVSWLEKNMLMAGRAMRADFMSLAPHPILVTNAVVPFQFVSDLPLDPSNVVPLGDLGRLLDQKRSKEDHEIG